MHDGRAHRAINDCLGRNAGFPVLRNINFTVAHYVYRAVYGPSRPLSTAHPPTPLPRPYCASDVVENSQIYVRNGLLSQRAYVAFLSRYIVNRLFPLSLLTLVIKRCSRRVVTRTDELGRCRSRVSPDETVPPTTSLLRVNRSDVIGSDAR